MEKIGVKPKRKDRYDNFTEEKKDINYSFTNIIL